MSKPQTTSSVPPRTEVALLTGGQDPHYAYGLAAALAAQGVCVEIIGSDELDRPEFHDPPRLRFLNLRGGVTRNASPLDKARRILKYYSRLTSYVAAGSPRLLHILWNNRFEYFDRTVMMVLYRLLGKRVVLTAHNVNAAKRDSQDSLLNRLTLRFQYRLCDHIFVHTAEMHSELVDDFGIDTDSITVIPYGINNAIPRTTLTSAEARSILNISSDDRVLLFFGAIAPYKGLDLLLDALRILIQDDCRYRLVIAGRPKGGCDEHLQAVMTSARATLPSSALIERIGFVPDEQIEFYFKAADVLVLPYRAIFQSGILIMAFSFGLPVVATSVGRFSEDISNVDAGYVCPPNDPHELAAAIRRYFASDLFEHLDVHRSRIRQSALEKHSWDTVASLTSAAYSSLIPAGRLSRA